MSDYELKRVHFNEDIEWFEENVVNVLDVDLAIGAHCHRDYALETIILNFCKTLQKSKKNGRGRMIEIFARLSTIDDCDTLFERIFNNVNNIKSILFLLYTDFEAWMQFCHCIGEQFIKQHEHVHRALVENLELQVDRVVTVNQLHKLLTLFKEFKILNSTTMRLKLFRNQLLTREKWKEVVNIVMQIVWKYGCIDEDNCTNLRHETAELFVNLFKDDSQREYSLTLFKSLEELISDDVEDKTDCKEREKHKEEATLVTKAGEEFKGACMDAMEQFM